jgi:hypothetical protein
LNSLWKRIFGTRGEVLKSRSQLIARRVFEALPPALRLKEREGFKKIWETITQESGGEISFSTLSDLFEKVVGRIPKTPEEGIVPGEF